MSPTAVPARITIDFRDSLDPARAWILGVGGASARVELLAFDVPAPDLLSPAAAGLEADCTCPDFCERDHDVD